MFLVSLLWKVLLYLLRGFWQKEDLLSPRNSVCLMDSSLHPILWSEILQKPLRKTRRAQKGSWHHHNSGPPYLEHQEGVGKSADKALSFHLSWEIYNEHLRLYLPSPGFIPNPKFQPNQILFLVSLSG